MKTILYIICTLAVIGITGYLFYIQTESKSKILIALIGVYIFASGFLGLYDHFANKPKARLILYQIEQLYNTPSPSSVWFYIHINNIGNAKATNLKITLTIKLNNKILSEKEMASHDLGPGQTAISKFGFKGAQLKEIMRDENELKIQLKATYDGGVLDAEAKYYTDKHDGFATLPSWTIVER